MAPTPSAEVIAGYTLVRDHDAKKICQYRFITSVLVESLRSGGDTVPDSDIRLPRLEAFNDAFLRTVGVAGNRSIVIGRVRDSIPRRTYCTKPAMKPEPIAAVNVELGLANDRIRSILEPGSCRQPIGGHASIEDHARCRDGSGDIRGYLAGWEN